MSMFCAKLIAHLDDENLGKVTPVLKSIILKTVDQVSTLEEYYQNEFRSQILKVINNSNCIKDMKLLNEYLSCNSNC